MQGIHCAFTARLGNDPEQRYTEAGKPLLPFGVVVDENITATADCPKTETLWLRVTCQDTLAKVLAAVLQRGMPVYIEGRLKHDKWEGTEGQPRCGLSVSARRCQVHGQLGKYAPRRYDAPAGAIIGATENR